MDTEKNSRMLPVPVIKRKHAADSECIQLKRFKNDRRNDGNTDESKHGSPWLWKTWRNASSEEHCDNNFTSYFGQSDVY